MKKYLLYFLAICWARLLRRRAPIFVTLCVTNRCNLRCAYCYEEYYDRQHADVPLERLLALVDELAAMGTRYISINGGEALLRRDLEALVDKVRVYGMILHLSTNGLLIPNSVSLLRKIDSIAVSLDGIGASNDRNRGEGSYAKIRAGIEALRQARIPFHIHTVLTKNNKDAVDDMLAFARECDSQVQFSLLREEDSPDKTLGLGEQELKTLVQKILADKKAGAPVFFSAQAYEAFLAWPLPTRQAVIRGKLPTGFNPVPCYVKQLFCHIEANGYVYPCVVLVNKFKALNYLDVGFKKAWAALAENDCLACQNICCNDMNLILSLSRHSIFNAFKIVQQRLWKRSGRP